MKESYGQHEIVLLDVEASGKDLEVTYPIEVAWLSLTEDSDSFLINPESAKGWDYWNQYAEDHIHHISRNECIAEGLTTAQACIRLNSQLRGCLVVSDALEWDRTWLQKMFDDADVQMKFDMISMPQFVMAIGKHPDLSGEFYFTKREQRDQVVHRALADCEQNLNIMKSVGIIK